MSSAPWGNETERADYYQKELDNQRAICKRLQTENDAHSRTEKVLSETIYNYEQALKQTTFEMYTCCLDELREKIVNTPFNVDCEGKSHEYVQGCLDGLAAKQNNILDIMSSLLLDSDSCE